MENTAATVQPRSLEPGKDLNFLPEDLNFLIQLNSSGVISHCSTGEVLGTRILKELIEFHVHFLHQSSREESLF